MDGRLGAGGIGLEHPGANVLEPSRAIGVGGLLSAPSERWQVVFSPWLLVVGKLRPMRGELCDEVVALQLSLCLDFKRQREVLCREAGRVLHSYGL